MTPAPMPMLVTLDQAHELWQGGAIFIDATYFAASEGRSAREEYEAAHLPDARFFDLEEMSDPTNPLPHMLASPQDLAARLGALGISPDQPVIIYDRPKLRSAPRAWWSLRYLGFDQIAILDGGFAAWQAAGLPVEAGQPSFTPTPFTPQVREHLRVSLDQVIAAVQEGSALILDARPPARFSGAEGDSWTPRRGHICDSVNFSAGRLLTPEGRLKDINDLRVMLPAILDARPVITTCGSGIAAATLAFALALVGRETAVFDGSWAEWGQDPRTLPLTKPLQD